MDLSVGLKPKSNTWAMEYISHFVILLLLPQIALYSNYLHTHHFPFSLFQYPALLILLPICYFNHLLFTNASVSANKY